MSDGTICVSENLLTMFFPSTLVLFGLHHQQSASISPGQKPTAVLESLSIKRLIQQETPVKLGILDTNPQLVFNLMGLLTDKCHVATDACWWLRARKGLDFKRHKCTDKME